MDPCSVAAALENRIVRSVVPEGRPPPVCNWNSHHEKVSGSTAVPLPGVPQITVALATARPSSNPSTWANACVRCDDAVTVTVCEAGVTGDTTVWPCHR